jgi:hypothetical protein
VFFLRRFAGGGFVRSVWLFCAVPGAVKGELLPASGGEQVAGPLNKI